MLILNDYRYKGILSNDFINYLVELACINELLRKKEIDGKIYEKMKVEILNSHIGKKN